MNTPEFEGQSMPKDVEIRAEDMEVPPQLEREGGIQTHPTQFTQQVTDDQGNQIIQTPATQQVSITIPSDQTQLTTWSKGSIVDSLTWFALYWLRMLKKAAFYGWKVLISGGEPHNHAN